MENFVFHVVLKVKVITKSAKKPTSSIQFFFDYYVSFCEALLHIKPTQF